MKPLEGITILEFSTMITAALASMMLAEQGARVIKVEPCDAGDPMRYIGARKGDISSLFAGCNRGKESIKLDLKSEAGRRSSATSRLRSTSSFIISGPGPWIHLASAMTPSVH